MTMGADIFGWLARTEGGKYGHVGLRYQDASRRGSFLGHLILGSSNLDYLAKTIHEEQTPTLLLVAGYARLFAYNTVMVW